MTFIGLTLTHLFSCSFHAVSYARAAARYNHVSVGVEDFKRNRIRIPFRVFADHNHAHESLCRRPDSGGAKNEGLGHRAVGATVLVVPDTQAGSAQRGSWPAVVTVSVPPLAYENLAGKVLSTTLGF